ncbi:MAG: HNH endonuclease [Terracidiphilus sp.]|jgi:hypothetical protein
MPGKVAEVELVSVTRPVERLLITECLFCRGSGPFSTTEHIVPESLGNDTDILHDSVCDGCQNYLSHSVEKPALEKTPFGFWRTYLGTLTKRNKLPEFVSTAPKSGRLPAVHPMTDTFKIAAEEDGSTSVELAPALLGPVASGERNSLRIVMSPWHLSILGRFLGKMGLEYVALTMAAEAMLPLFDPLRRYVRHGSVNSLWPIYYGQSGSLGELRTEECPAETGEIEIESECYRYSIGERIDGGYIFAFGIGTDLYAIDLTRNVPDSFVEKAISGCLLQCLHYGKGTF